MQISSDTLKNFGFDKIWSLLEPRSALGQAVKRSTIPFGRDQPEIVHQELNSLEIVVQKMQSESELVEQLHDVISSIKDIRRSIESSTTSVLDDVELDEIKNMLVKLRSVCHLVNVLDLKVIFPHSFGEISPLLCLLSKGQGNKESFFLADEYSKELDRVRTKRKGLQAKMLRLKRMSIRPFEEMLGRVIGDEFAISRSNTELNHKLAADSRLVIVRESFLSITYAIKKTDEECQLEQQFQIVKEQEEKEKLAVRQVLSHAIGGYWSQLLSMLEDIGHVDMFIAKAKLSQLLKCTKPVLTDENKLEIVDGVHPIVDIRLKEQGMEFMPISITLSQGTTLITGVNMGGKTVCLKLLGLLVCMVHHGLFVPARRMSMGLRDFVHFSVAEDNTVLTGLSRFAQEIVGLKKVLARKDDRGLVLVDEIAHGTNPQEGAAIAQSIIEFMDKSCCICLVTTHYALLTVCSSIRHLRVRGLDYSKLSNGIWDMDEKGCERLNRFMDYRLETASSTAEVPRDAIKIAELMGFDKSILQRAHELITKG